MLTPPLSEDCPEGTRLSGYRLEIQPGDQLNLEGPNSAPIAQLIGRVQSLEREMRYLKQQLEAIGLSGAGAAGAATKFLPPGPDRDP